MRPVCTLVVILATQGSIWAQKSEPESVDILIKKLGSAKFTTREQAAKALLERPEAEAALRLASASADTETQRRIDVILDYYDRRPLRQLNECITTGRMDEFITRVANWPERKYENELWTTVTTLFTKIYGLHVKKGGTRFPNPAKSLKELRPISILKAGRITDSTHGEMERIYFLRAREIKLGCIKPVNNEFDKYGIPVVADTAYFGSLVPCIVVAGKGIIVKCQLRFTIIICGGDVILEKSAVGSLIIARGNILQSNIGHGASDNHMIAGKKVLLPGPNENNLIVENEPNPLGYIRWSDAPKVEPKRR